MTAYNFVFSNTANQNQSLRMVSSLALSAETWLASYLLVAVIAPISAQQTALLFLPIKVDEQNLLSLEIKLGETYLVLLSIERIKSVNKH